MDNLPEETKSPATPMWSVWKVVLGTILLTSVAGFLWHTMGMTKVRVEDTHEALEVREENERLIAHRDKLTASATSTPLKKVSQ